MPLSRPLSPASSPLTGGTSSEVIGDTQPASRLPRQRKASRGLAGDLCPLWALVGGECVELGASGEPAPENRVCLFESKLGGLARAAVGMLRPLRVGLQPREGWRGGTSPPPTPAPGAWMGVLGWAAAWCSRRRPLFIICSVCVCVCVCVCARARTPWVSFFFFNSFSSPSPCRRRPRLHIGFWKAWGPRWSW